eukprot:c49271_g1_i1.p1 GENE.c49271_g1_i1~~c49271_g1_i1.p1  ORF type:complete len:120 (-),score=3.81 c49271_g1_i1:144-503(-)
MRVQPIIPMINNNNHHNKKNNNNARNRPKVFQNAGIKIIRNQHSTVRSKGMLDWSGGFILLLLFGSLNRTHSTRILKTIFSFICASRKKVISRQRAAKHVAVWKIVKQKNSVKHKQINK